MSKRRYRLYINVSCDYGRRLARHLAVEHPKTKGRIRLLHCKKGQRWF